MHASDATPPLNISLLRRFLPPYFAPLIIFAFHIGLQRRCRHFLIFSPPRHFHFRFLHFHLFSSFRCAACHVAPVLMPPDTITPDSCQLSHMMMIR